MLNILFTNIILINQYNICSQRKQLFPLRNYPTYAIITLGGFPITALHYKGA